MRGRATVALVTVVLGAALTASLGSPAALAAPRPDVETVRKQVETLQEEVGAAAERYNASREKLKTATLLGKAATVRVQQQQKVVDEARRRLGQVAAETYKAGDLHAVSVLLSDDPQSRLAAAGLLTTLGERQAQAVQNLVAAQDRLTADKAALAAQTAALAAESKRIDEGRKEVEAKLAARQRLLASLTAEQRVAIARAGTTMDRDSLRQLGVQVPAGGRLTCDDVGVQAPSARVAAAIAFACAQLGEPYRWGGDGPSSWDCSGLTQAAWAQAGVSLPHNARMQSGYGRKVSVSELQPGDLIFFNDFGHMGMYLGKGLMIHAPRTGDVVKVSSSRMGQIIAATRV